MKAKTFDSKFDSGEKIVNRRDLMKARRIGTDAKRLNVDPRHGWWILSTAKRAGWP
jgi:hypothetical protein